MILNKVIIYFITGRIAGVSGLLLKNAIINPETPSKISYIPKCLTGGVTATFIINVINNATIIIYPQTIIFRVAE